VRRGGQQRVHVLQPADAPSAQGRAPVHCLPSRQHVCVTLWVVSVTRTAQVELRNGGVYECVFFFMFCTSSATWKLGVFWEGTCAKFAENRKKSVETRRNSPHIEPGAPGTTRVRTWLGTLFKACTRKPLPPEQAARRWTEMATWLRLYALTSVHAAYSLSAASSR
jgi:hypothetical protein